MTFQDIIWSRIFNNLWNIFIKSAETYGVKNLLDIFGIAVELIKCKIDFIKVITICNLQLNCLTIWCCSLSW